MTGRRPDGKPLGHGEAPDDAFFLHHIFRLHGIPAHEVEAWDSGWKRFAFVSIGLQLEEELKRLKAGIGRVM